MYVNLYCVADIFSSGIFVSQEDPISQICDEFKEL